jgi:uncharacterized membrane protein YagU involved in acid resistance
VGDLPKGVEAGFIATVLISLLIYAQRSLGIQPEFDLLGLLAKAAATRDVYMVWILHFLVGSVLWGGLFAAFSPHLPGPKWLRGALFGVLAWLAMMLAFMPAAGLPIFAMGMGPSIPVSAFVLHMIFGITMGETYQLLVHYFPGEVEEEKA